MDNFDAGFDSFDDFSMDIEDDANSSVDNSSENEELGTSETSDFDFSDFNTGENDNTSEDDVEFDDNDFEMDADEENSEYNFGDSTENTADQADNFETSDNQYYDLEEGTEDTDDFNMNSEDQQQNSSLFDEMNNEGGWTSSSDIKDESISDQTLVDAFSDNSFDGLFMTASGNTSASSGMTASILPNRIEDGAFKLDYIDINDIIVWQPRIRSASDVTALTTSIRNDGLLQPLVVAPTQTEGKYVLIKGARRLLACASLKMRKIPCVINSQVNVSDIHVIEPLYSHNKTYSVSDMLKYIDYLRDEKKISAPSMIEYLLNLNSGDYLKLMDVMDDNDDEIVGALLSGQLDIGSAYKKLEQKRKKIGRDKMSDARVAKIYDDAAKYGVDILADSGETGTDTGLTEEEQHEIIDSLGDMEDMSDVDGDALMQEGNSIAGYEAHKQDPNNRERLDPKTRKSVLARDNNTCRICGMGGQEYIETLDVHHLVEVYLGGNDDINNLITACTVCHKLVHLWGRGELMIRPFTEMDEAEANKFKRIIKLGNIIRKGMASKGMKKEQLKKVDQADTIGRRLKGSSDQVAG